MTARCRLLGWLVRVVVGVLVTLVPGVVTVALISALGPADGGGTSGLGGLTRAAGVALGAVAGIAAAYAAYHLVVVRALEGRRRPEELAPRGAPRDLVVGLAAGVVLVSTVVAVIAAIGGATVSAGSPLLETVTAVVAVAVVPAFVEELAFRGVLFRITEQLAGTWAALVASAALFGLVHLLNRGATMWSCLAIALEAGLLLAAVYLITRRLWACVGLHLGWNLVQILLGLPVSGGDPQPGPRAVRLHGSQLVTGGAFGPEASIVAVVLLTAVGAGLLWYTHRRGRFVACPARRGGRPGQPR